MEVSGPSALMRQVRRVKQPLVAVVAVSGLVTVVALVGLVVDPREITGQPAWAKPARFAFSFGLYGVTVIWLLTFVRGHERLVRIMCWTTVTGVSVEAVAAAWAAAAGTTSHFNFSTVLAGTRTLVMLLASLALVLVAVVAVVLLLRERVEPPALAWALRLGLVVLLAGMAVPYLMVQPTPAQEAAADLGRGMPVIGAHTVGLPDGGPGMPVTNFSTEGGDWRVAHFVGVHSLQALVLLGLLLTLGPRMLGPRHRTALVWVAAGVCLALTGILTWQTHRAQPLTAPDTATATALTALAVTAAAATATVFLHARVTRHPLRGDT
ncbi:hypothetical protein ACWD4V_24090 [Streptomyces tsukubensis]